MEITYKGFKINSFVTKKEIIFIDDVKYINCYGLTIEYPKYKYNVMINHLRINELEEIEFNKLRSIKEWVYIYIDKFYIDNKLCFKVE